MTSNKEVEPLVAEVPPPDAPAEMVEAPPKDDKVDKSEEEAVEGKTVQDVKADNADKAQMIVLYNKNKGSALERVKTEKRLSFIKAWEDREKSKVENKAQKKLSELDAWENSKKASLEAKFKKLVEALEKKKAAYAEDMKNKAAHVHKQADEKRAIVVAKRQEDVLKAEEQAEKYRETNQTPKKGVGCFG